MLAALVLSIFALSVPQEVGEGSVRGEVRSERTGGAVPYAVVEVVGTLAPRTARADSAGRYLLRGVPPGRRLLRAQGIDHAPLEVEVLVREGKEVQVDFTLAFQPVVLPGITVRGETLPSLADTMRARRGELGRAELRSLEASPGVVELGLGELARQLPSGQEPIDPSDVLYVRGAPTDLKRVFLDGAPVYSPFHVGGLLPAFDPELLRRAELHLGGAPARFDGALSYVLDLESRAANRGAFSTSGSADLLSAQASLEGPLVAGAAFMGGGRVVHGLGADWLSSDPFPYGYADALGRVDVPIGGRGALGVTGFWNRESVRLDAAGRGEEAVWGNRAGSLRYRGPLAGREGELIAAVGIYDAHLPLEGGGRTVIADGTARQLRLVANLSEGAPGRRVHYGASYERIALAYSSYGRFQAQQNTFLLATQAEGETGSAYVDLDWSVSPRVRLRGGLRGDYFSTDGTFRTSPRLSLRWLLTERASLTLAAGRYRQLVRAGEGSVVESADRSALVLSGPPLSPARASHFLLALDQMLVEELRLGIEGYYKRFEGIPSGQDAAAVPMAGGAGGTSGATAANASGVDLWLRRSSGRLTGWLGYSLGWVWAESRSAGPTDLFSGRQLLSIGLSGEVGAGGEVAFRLGYGAGIPFSAIPTPVPNAADRSSAPLSSLNRAVTGANYAVAPQPAPDEPYVRLDLEASYPWKARLGGAGMTITPYLKVLNALDRRDALFYRADGAEGGAPRALATLPILPVVGVQWKF
jgi:hypothetical protein